MDKRKLNLAVIMGGLSSEKEISLESGRHIYNNLNRDKYEITAIFMDSKAQFWVIEEGLLWMNTTVDLENALSSGGKRLYYEELRKYDFVFLALHGKYGEDGCIQGLLELLDIPYNGSGVLGSALGNNKYYSQELVKSVGLHTPKTILVKLRDYQEKNLSQLLKENNLNFPLIIKPNREGCSTALSLARNMEELYQGVEKALEWDNEVLIEEDLSAGIEVTTTILGNQELVSLLPTETPKKGNFLTLEEKFLPGDARMITPPNLPSKAIKDIQEDSLKAYQILGLKVYSRIDAIWKNKKLYFLEANTLPGVTPSTCVFHQAAEAGMNATQFFDKIISLSLQAHKNKIGPL